MPDRVLTEGGRAAVAKAGPGDPRPGRTTRHSGMGPAGPGGRAHITTRGTPARADRPTSTGTSSFVLGILVINTSRVGAVPGPAAAGPDSTSGQARPAGHRTASIGPVPPTKLELAFFFESCWRWAPGPGWGCSGEKAIWAGWPDGAHAKKGTSQPAKEPGGHDGFRSARLRQGRRHLDGARAQAAGGRRGPGPELTPSATAAVRDRPRRRRPRRRVVGRGCSTLYGAKAVKRYKTFMAPGRAAGGADHRVVCWVDETTGWRAYSCTPTGTGEAVAEIPGKTIADSVRWRSEVRECEQRGIGA